MDDDTNNEVRDALVGIGAFARRVGLSPSALRYYDDCGVMRPASVDPGTGYRSYAPEQEARALRLRALREAEVPLPEAVAVLDGPPEHAEALLRTHLDRMRERADTARVVVEGVLRSLTTTGTRASIGGAEWASAVRQVAPAAGAGEPAVLGCVLVEVADGEVRLVATDRYRLSVRTLRPGRIEGGPGQALVRVGDLIALGPWATRHREIDLELDADGFRLRAGDEVHEPATSADTYPAYRDMLAALATPQTRVVVDRAALREALLGEGRGLGRGRDEDENHDPGEDHDHGEDRDQGRKEDQGRDPSPSPSPSRVRVLTTTLDGIRVDAGALPAICAGPATRLAFDPGTLVPALDAGVGPDVLLDIAAPDLPVLVRSADQGSFTTLVMPVALPKAGNPK
ncbi:MerR family transcriptional regulator [Embleya sp. NPDC050154]|uniref:MerR family transcriptional regulator n=1 Tax=unclassified Embleya TaxID=2699296 RepID=UPI0037A66612